MKLGVVIRVFVVGTLVAWTIPHWLQPIAGQAAAIQAPHKGEGGVPQFQLDRSFPQIPAKWKMGFVSSIAFDADNNVWVLSRERNLAHPRLATDAPDLTSTPAPPVTEFDSNGKFIRGWGGENGPGYQWPSNEHGITVDSKGFVWILGDANEPGGNDNPAHLPSDHQVLKFTADGKFVMAIGEIAPTDTSAPGTLKDAQAVRVDYKTNEVYVAESGHSRVVVFDANTGAFKRMWGANGNKPLDVDQRPQDPDAKGVCPTCSFRGGVLPALQQFAGPHDITLSDDGLLYVSDRGNKRIQVFTTDGNFVGEQFMGLDLLGEQVNGAGLSPDRKFLYVAGTPVVFILNRQTLELLGTFDARTDAGLVTNHQLNVDRQGNVYVAGAESGVHKFVLQGYSPKTSCPPCQTTKGGIE